MILKDLLSSLFDLVEVLVNFSFPCLLLLALESFSCKILEMLFWVEALIVTTNLKYLLVKIASLHNLAKETNTLASSRQQISVSVSFIILVREKGYWECNLCCNMEVNISRVFFLNGSNYHRWREKKTRSYLFKRLLRNKQIRRNTSYIIK